MIKAEEERKGNSSLQLQPAAQSAIECFDVIRGQVTHDLPNELGFHGRQLPLHGAGDIQPTGLPIVENEVPILEA